jgi:hypothetical protein
VPTLVEASVEVVIANADGVIVTGGAEVGANALGATTIVVVAEVTWAGLLLSVTASVKVEVPLAVGTPEIAPVDSERVSPGGSLPEITAHV